jgi:hypothetical protein
MLKKIHELRLAEAAKAQSKKTTFTPIPDPKKVKQNQTNELNLPVF